MSSDHDDTWKVHGFLGLRNTVGNFEFYTRRLDHHVNNGNEGCIRRVIREDE